MALTRRRRRLARRFGAFACCAVLAAGAAPPAPAQDQAVKPGLAPAIPSDAGTTTAVTPVEGFRHARFGMSEPELRRAIGQDFPAAAERLARTTHPSEKTTVLAATVADMLPDTGPARISYILGYASKKLIQINIVWSSDGRSAAADEVVVAAANMLRDHLQAEHLAPPDQFVLNRQVGENAFLVFRAAQGDARMVLLLLSGVGAAGRASRTLPPLTLQLSYIGDYKHPDVFHIERGRF